MQVIAELWPFIAAALIPLTVWFVPRKRRLLFLWLAPLLGYLFVPYFFIQGRAGHETVSMVGGIILFLFTWGLPVYYFALVACTIVIMHLPPEK